MPIPERALKALNAMKEYGFSIHTSKPILKNLLKVYAQNWEYIEADSYQVLVDALLDQQDSQTQEILEAGERKKIHGDDGTEKNDAADNSEYNSRKSRPREEEQTSSAALPNSDVNAKISRKRQKIDAESVPGALAINSSSAVLPQSSAGEHGGHARFSQVMRSERTSSLPQPYSDKVQFGSTLGQYNKDESCDDTSAVFEAPLAILAPPSSSHARKGVAQHQEMKDDSFSTTPNKVCGTAMPLVKGRLVGDKSHMINGNKISTESELATPQEASSTVDVAASDFGEVKLTVTCTVAGPNFHMPSMDDVLRRVEAKCLSTYKILEPTFNIKNILKQVCQSFLELGSECSEDNHQNPVNIIPTIQSLKNPIISNISADLPACCNLPSGLKIPGLVGTNADSELSVNNENRETNNIIGISSCPVTPLQPQLVLTEIRPLHDVNDISKGEERVRVAIVNEINSEKYPSSFNYIPRSIVFQNAYVNFSLARISDEDCCPDCFIDCLTSPLRCSCVQETGGDFVYTTDGLLKRNFLDDCIYKNLKPENRNLYICKDCPVERTKNEQNPETCKGHVKRKFIKECWSKCGCSKECGNRVVQRGITCNLQVFMTPEGKGWGLRTLDEIPRGAFVCEYAGEVLTNMELYQRTTKNPSQPRHTYPILLDADWGSKGTLKDEEVLCLDATFYGNVARFVNHRCRDANLIEVPVEVETPDHHYYHVAFFTTRKVEPLEELTWDYGIEFGDHNYPKTFKCRCGSRYCRDRKHNRSKRSVVSG